MKLLRTLLMFALAGFATRLYLDHRNGRARADDHGSASRSGTP